MFIAKRIVKKKRRYGIDLLKCMAKLILFCLVLFLFVKETYYHLSDLQDMENLCYNYFK